MTDILQKEAQIEVTTELTSLINEAITAAIHRGEQFMIRPKMQELKQIKATTEEELRSKIKRLGEILVEMTGNNCQVSSLFCLYYLKKYYPQLFTDMLLIKTDEKLVEGDQGLEPAKFSEEDKRNFHVRFLIKGIDGNWYSGSPANYPQGEYDEANRLHLDFEKRDNIEDLIAYIRTKDRHNWPDSSEIEKTLSKERADVAMEDDNLEEDPSFGLAKISFLSVAREKGAILSKSNKYYLAYSQYGEFFSQGLSSIDRAPQIN